MNTEIMSYLPASEALINGLITTLAGMVVVFIALACLIFITILLSKAVRALTKEKKAEPLKSAPATVAAGELNGATVAAVAAAIATAMETDPKGLRIVSMKKIG